MRGLPGVLVDLVQAHRSASSIVRLNPDHMPGKFAHEIAARNPDR
jgi:hypothetical protein